MSNSPNQPRQRKSKAQRCELDLAMPPHGDNASAIAQWLAAASGELKNQNPIQITGPAALRIRVGLQQQLRDLTAIAQGLRNLLVAFGVIASETAVVDLEASWDRTVPPNRVHLALWRTSPPHQRISAESRRRLRITAARRWADARAGGTPV
jgi:hypothetical protein